jgi:catechol 2,3-dioxygenase-like lactoylglutathione lyase family enzyme
MNAPWISRQLPEKAEVFIDHVGYFVADLEAAGAQLERLGFRVSLVNVQTNADARGELKPSGTSNRLARLRFGFLEILAATHDTPLADQFKLQIARYAGLHLIAFSAADMRAERTRLTGAGFAMQGIVELRRRDRTLPDDPVVHFSVLRPQPGVMVEGRIQWVRPNTPDSVWRPDTITTENGAEGLSDTLLVVDDPAAAAARYGRYAGRDPVRRGDTHVVALERGGLVFVDHGSAARLLPAFRPPAVPFMAGQALRADLARAREVLARAGVTPVFASSELICVGPEDGLGGYLLFHAPGVNDPWGAMGAG